MTPRQLELVQDSFAALRPLPKDLGIAFYQRLLAANPSMAGMFKGSIENQSAMFVSALALTVAGIAPDGSLPSSVRDLGARHAGYGVRPEHYGPFRDALLDTFAERLGDVFTPEVRQAWSAAFDELAEAMRSQTAPRP
ncbi:MAG: hemin receptor [Acidobacteria bacterium]|nr:hemin receptor [Acidobacteriota bacterium]